MGFRERLLRWLARGDDTPLDPDEPVELSEVALHQGPMLLAKLQEAGIDARGVEAFSYVSDVTDRMRIMVLRRDAARAHEVLEAHYRRLRD